MYYFLGIVTENDMLNGKFSPTFVLTPRNESAGKRADWIVRRVGKATILSKVLVTTLVGHDDMIDYVSKYRIRILKDHINFNIVIRGGLFWFPCDIYGIQCGPALFIKRVPDAAASQHPLRTLKAYRSRVVNMNELLTRDSSMIDLIHSHIKPKLSQKGRRGTNASKKGNRSSAGKA